jgi:hypothetical protein
MTLYRTCVKDNTNVTEIFDHLCETHAQERAKAQDRAVAAQIGGAGKGGSKAAGKSDKFAITPQANKGKKKKKRCAI